MSATADAALARCGEKGRAAPSKQSAAGREERQGARSTVPMGRFSRCARAARDFARTSRRSCPGLAEVSCADYPATGQRSKVGCEKARRSRARLFDVSAPRSGRPMRRCPAAWKLSAEPSRGRCQSCLSAADGSVGRDGAGRGVPESVAAHRRAAPVATRGRGAAPVGVHAGRRPPPPTTPAQRARSGEEGERKRGRGGGVSGYCARVA